MKHPKAVYLLIAVQIWERFSFYGMRTLLVLFMIQELSLSHTEAIGIYALFSTLVNLGALVGGFFADKMLGLKKSVFIGGGFIGIGHLFLTMGVTTPMVLGALAMIIAGTSFFSPNLKAHIPRPSCEFF
ncbi:MAG: hypothetical protein Tsb0021_16880 [Chlamydiales bacterium]